MIGLEYILNLYGMQHQELAEKLGIKKQNINLWIKGKQAISKKYLPKLSEMFGIGEEYFQKELDEVDRLVIQKEKLSKDLKPEIIGYEMQLAIGEDTDLIQKPIYNTRIINDIELEINKAKVINDFREIISNTNNDIEVQMFEQLNRMFKDNGKNPLLQDTIDALSHYFNVLPEWVGEPESNEFVACFLELVDMFYKDGRRIKNNY